MAVRTRAEIMDMVKTLVGDDTSDESLNTIGDISDTLEDLEKRSNGDGTDWKKKYEENDAEWRQKYKDRFFNTETAKDEKSDPNGADDTTKKETELKASFDELFEEKE